MFVVNELVPFRSKPRCADSSGSSRLTEISPCENESTIPTPPSGRVERSEGRVERSEGRVERSEGRGPPRSFLATLPEGG